MSFRIRSIAAKQSEETLLKRATKFYPNIDYHEKTIDGITIKNILQSHATPLFIASKQSLINVFQLLSSELYSIHQDSRIAYSLKTNNILWLAHLYKTLGAYIEVVSEAEYYCAKNILQYQNTYIIYNGPYKSKKSFEDALLNHSIVNLNHSEEIDLAINVAKKYNKQCQVGIRVNTTKNGLPPSRFGFSIEYGEAKHAVQRVISSKYLKLSGIHCHIGSNIAHPSHYKRTSAIVSQFVAWVEQSYKTRLTYLDFGGGFPSFESLNPRSIKEHTIRDYLYAIVSEMQKYDISDRTLFIEPGRFLVDSSFILVSQVISSNIRGNTQDLICDSSVNILPLAYLKQPRIHSIQKKQKQRNASLYKTTVYGPSCMESDVIAKSIYLPKLHEGDLLIFFSVGAYNISFNNQFIFPRPATIIIDKQTMSYKAMRNEEQYIDIWRRDEI